MPHQCTNCGKTFDDGSKEMLSGCPGCGGNKFQFQPRGATKSTDPAGDANQTEAATASRATPSSPDSATENSSDDRGGRSGVTGTAAKAGASVREWVENRTSDRSVDGDGADSPTDTDDGITSDSSPDAQTESSRSESVPSAEASNVDVDAEDRAQASARSDVVTPEELSAARASPSADAEADKPSDADETVIEPESDDRPDLSELREELNDQFESIKILSPGQYELNLMELYDREEYIISLREDGRYVIEVPDTWRGTNDE